MIEDFITVYQAEIMRRIRSRPYIIGLLFGVLAITLLSRLPALMESAFSGASSIVLAGDPALVSRAKPLLTDYKIVGTLPDAPVDDATLKQYHAGSAVELRAQPDGLHVTVYSRNPGGIHREALSEDLLPLQLQLVTHRNAGAVAKITAIPITVKVIASKFASAGQASAARGVAYTLLFLLYLLIILNSQLVMSSVAEEKTSRIAELLIASVNPSALLTGKILASATLGFLQLAVWIAAAAYSGGGGSSASSSGDSLLSLSNALDVLTPGLVVAFLVFFIIGFLQLSTLFAAAASLINRTEDLGSIALPLVMPIVFAFIIAIAALSSPDAPLAVVCSYLPLIAPFVMFARIAVSNVPLWQVALSIGINLVALYVIAVLAGKIYRVGMLLYGRAPNLRQVWSVIRS
ncbi:MAG: ABC transporter permease [Candidatus Aquilonibacter sp.]